MGRERFKPVNTVKCCRFSVTAFCWNVDYEEVGVTPGWWEIRRHKIMHDLSVESWCYYEKKRENSGEVKKKMGKTSNKQLMNAYIKDALNAHKKCEIFYELLSKIVIN